jgi:hypothetical protein
VGHLPSPLTSAQILASYVVVEDSKSLSSLENRRKKQHGQTCPKSLNFLKYEFHVRNIFLTDPYFQENTQVQRYKDQGKVRQGKAIPVTGRGGPQGYETSRLPHFLDNWLTDGGKVVSLTRCCPLPPGRFLILMSVRG